MIRIGKIARLPKEIREEINRRLEENEPAGNLLGWLNAAPAVAEVMARDFGGARISEQNLSAWRAGGFREWLVRRESLDWSREMMSEAKEVAAATKGRLTESLATVVAARYAALLAEWDGEAPEEFSRKVGALKALGCEVLALRRSEQREARLKMDLEQQEREREAEERRLATYQMMGVPYLTGMCAILEEMAATIDQE
jgi:hypothetical protein